MYARDALRKRLAAQNMSGPRRQADVSQRPSNFVWTPLIFEERAIRRMIRLAKRGKMSGDHALQLGVGKPGDIDNADPMILRANHSGR
jgi:hypothetical protein